MNKTYLELASEIVTEMIKKNMINCPMSKGETWEQHNAKSIKTVGWAVLEMYREVQRVAARSKEPAKDLRAVQAEAMKNAPKIIIPGKSSNK